jgi:hypothetical protein
MKTFSNIKESLLVSKISQIVENPTDAAFLAKFSQDLRKFNNEIKKPNYLRSKEEKESFIQKIKLHNEYKNVTANKDVLVTLIQNDYFEFLLPYALSGNNMEDYKNIELTGLGFYEYNQDFIS